MRIVLTITMALLLWAQACPALGPGYSNSRAVVVGVDKYLLWPHLEYAVADARAVRQILEARGFKVKMLLDSQATAKNILKALAHELEDLDQDGRFVFYFSGHGQTEDCPGGREKGYLVPADADSYDWAGSMIAMSGINKIMSGARAKHILLVFDSCYSGLGLSKAVRIAPKQPARSYLDKMYKTRSIQVLTAGGRSEQALESGGHGLFTEHFLAALAGSADLNKDGHVTGLEIYSAIRPAVTSESYQRQTPLFGYIKGEGDMIFRLSAQADSRPAILEIASDVGGVDFWVDSDLVASGLGPSSPAVVKAAPGTRHLLAKKGARTMYKNDMALAPGSKRSIRITSGGDRRRNPFSLHTIHMQGVKRYDLSTAVDLDRDGREEFVVASGKTITCLRWDGSVIWKRNFPFEVRVTISGVWRGKTVVAANSVKADSVWLGLLDHEGRTAWSHTRPITRTYQGRKDGSGRIMALADLDGDGTKEIIAASGAGYTWKPRGIIAYDASARELWRFLTGPGVGRVQVWPNPEGPPDLILTGYAPGNGNSESMSRTDDSHSYVISVSARGRLNWVRRMEGNFTGTDSLLEDLDGDGIPELYVRLNAAYNYRRDVGGVFMFDRDGSIRRRFDSGNSIKSIIAAPARGSHPGKLYASDNHGNIIVFGPGLKKLNSVRLNRSDLNMHITLAGVEDYDGDGEREVLLQLFNRHQKGRNPRSDMGPRNKVHFTNIKFVVLSGDLSRVKKEQTIAEEWSKWRGFAVRNMPRPSMPLHPFAVFSDKITVFNF